MSKNGKQHLFEDKNLPEEKHCTQKRFVGLKSFLLDD